MTGCAKYFLVHNWATRVSHLSSDVHRLGLSASQTMSGYTVEGKEGDSI